MSTTPPPVNPPVPVIPPPPTTQNIEHVVVVIMQNASFDHFFGTFPGANGFTPTSLGFSQMDATGKAVSPTLMTNLAPPALREGRTAYLASINGGLMDKFAFTNGDIAMGYYDGTTPGISTLWSYAQQFALADNYFGSVIGEAPTNQLYMIAASDNEFPFSVQPVYPPCQKPDPAAQALTFPNVGDQMTTAGVTWSVYEESHGDCAATLATHNPFQYFTSTNASPNIHDYTQLATDLAAGKLPSVSFVIPDNSHDMHPGFAPVTSGAAFLDDLIKQIQASTAWNGTAIFITWDTGGGWYDHVAPPTPAIDTQGLAFRVPLIVVSPLAKKGYISHVQLDHVSLLAFIQKKFNLPALNTRNSMSGDVTDLFQ